MSNFQELAVNEALRFELGKTAKFWLSGREHRTPMTFVLDEVERQIGARFSVYWVEGGPPEVFCLTGFSPSPVVFSTRYLSITAFFRRLFIEDSLQNILVDVAEGCTLKIMAEMALRHGDPDYAVLAFAKSVIGKSVWLSDEDQVMALELEPVRESYMATWFYGLVHELGHLFPNDLYFPNTPIYSDDWILGAIKIALERFSPSYPDWLAQIAVERAQQQRATSVLGIDQVRDEGLADIFAASVLFKTTVEIMEEIKQRDPTQREFRLDLYVQEMMLFLNVITIIERCRRVAVNASATTSDRETLIEDALHPVSVMVRAFMQRQYLDSALTKYVYGTEYTREQFEEVMNSISGIAQHYKETIQKIDSGVARAMEFSLFHERRENDWVLLEKVRKDFSLPNAFFGLQEAKRFCDLADALGADGKLLRTLKDILNDPGKPLRPDLEGDLVYFVPWVEGPNGFQRPFGLNTKHGHLVFVFHAQGELYDAFFKPSAEMLAPGFMLQKAIVPVPRKERLEPELAANMPAGQVFQIVVEGTEEFAQYMKELSDDTIWED